MAFPTKKPQHVHLVTFMHNEQLNWNFHLPSRTLLLSAVSASAIFESRSLCFMLARDSSLAGGPGISFHLDTAEKLTTISVGFRLSTTSVLSRKRLLVTFLNIFASEDRNILQKSRYITVRSFCATLFNCNKSIGKGYTSNAETCHQVLVPMNAKQLNSINYFRFY